MTRALSLSPLISGAAATAGLVLGTDAIAPAANAQEADAPAPVATDDATVLPTITVTGAQASPNTNDAGTGIARLPGTVRETPQTITVVPQEIIQQQGVTTLEQALRNVPGITLSTGEGNGGQNGDQFRIRGLQAKGDIYVDGLRDFGVYNRDAFATESVEVIKGPSGETFGVGNVGGVINQTSKSAFLGDSNVVEGMFGTGPLYRGTFDTNFQLGETSALRITGMVQERDIADRDHAFADGAGIALDYGLGIGTDTEWHLNYMYQHMNGVPDYGVPMLEGSDGILRPITEAGLPGLGRSTSYIRSTDRNDTDVHVLTSLFSKRLDNGLVLNNDTRLSFYDRDFSSTNPAACTDDAEAGEFCATTIRNGGNYPLSYGAGGGGTYKQDGWAIQNVATARLDFQTGQLRHRGMVGLDASYQEDNRHSGTWTGRDSDQMIVGPRFSYPGARVEYLPEGKRSSTATNVGIFINDRIWFNDQISVQAGARWDYFESEFDSSNPTTATGSQDSSEISPTVSLIWEPNRSAMLYATFARSYRPVGTDIASAQNNGTSETPQDGVDLSPERSDLYEIGAKADFFGGRLGVTAAIFQIDKTNSQTIDPVTGEVVVGFSDAGQGRRIQGAELGLTGALTNEWSVTGAYAYMTGEITDAGDPDIVGNDAPSVPKNNLSLWTTYDLSGAVPGLAGDLLVGGGVMYASSYWADTANTAEIPETFSVDAMISYETDRYRVALNGYNLSDELNYGSAFNAVRAVPLPGRTVALTLSASF